MAKFSWIGMIMSKNFFFLPVLAIITAISIFFPTRLYMARTDTLLVYFLPMILLQITLILFLLDGRTKNAILESYLISIFFLSFNFFLFRGYYLSPLFIAIIFTPLTGGLLLRHS